MFRRGTTACLSEQKLGGRGLGDGNNWPARFCAEAFARGAVLLGGNDRLVPTAGPVLRDSMRGRGPPADILLFYRKIQKGCRELPDSRKALFFEHMLIDLFELLSNVGEVAFLRDFIARFDHGGELIF